MTTRKQQTPAKKRDLPPEAPQGRRGARSRPAKRRAAKPATGRGRSDGSLLLTAECTIAQADALKAQLKRRLRESQPVTLDVSALQRIDTAGLQLLAAFVRDRRTAGRTVTWRGQASALTTAAGILGLRDMLELPREAG